MLDEKKRVILLKSVVGTLILEVTYLKCPDNIASIPLIRIPSVHGTNTPPCIEWQAASLSVSDSSSDLSPPFSPLGRSVISELPEVLPNSLMGPKIKVEIPVKLERKSFDISQLAKECSKILSNFEGIVKQIETHEEVMKEYYSLLIDK